MNAALNQLMSAALTNPSISMHKATEMARQDIPELAQRRKELSRASTQLLGLQMDLEDAKRSIRDLKEVRDGADNGSASLKNVYGWLQRAIRS